MYKYEDRLGLNIIIVYRLFLQKYVPGKVGTEVGTKVGTEKWEQMWEQKWEQKCLPGPVPQARSAQGANALPVPQARSARGAPGGLASVYKYHF